MRRDTYAIPFSSQADPFEIRLQAGSSHFDLQVVSITLSNRNYKLDFNVQENGANGDASVGYPASALNRSIDSLPTERPTDTMIHYAPE